MKYVFFKRVLFVFRTVGFNAIFVLWTIISLFPIPILFLRRSWCIWYGRLCFTIANIVLKAFCGIKFKVDGVENIPKEKNFILVSKHLSVWETFFFAWYFNIPVYILKKSLLHIPVFGWYMSRTGMVGIDRSGGISTVEQIANAAKDVIEVQKRTLIIFPQGTRTPIDASYSLKKYPYKKGVIAMCSKVPSVKVLLATHNAVKYFGKGFFSIKRPGVIIVKFLPTIQMDGKTGEQFLLQIQDTIESETKQIL